MPCYLYPGGTDGGVTMFKDPIVEEVRNARQKHAADFNYDLKKIAEDLNRKQEQSKRKTISYPPKPASVKKSA